MTQEQKWLSYVAQLREKHDKELDIFKKIKDDDFRLIQSLQKQLDYVTIKLKDKDQTIERLENDLSDGVKILETIWLAFDRDYLMRSLLSTDYENLKNYLGK